MLAGGPSAALRANDLFLRAAFQVKTIHKYKLRANCEATLCGKKCETTRLIPVFRIYIASQHARKASSATAMPMSATEGKLNSTMSATTKGPRSLLCPS